MQVPTMDQAPGTALLAARGPTFLVCDSVGCLGALALA